MKQKEKKQMMNELLYNSYLQVDLGVLRKNRYMKPEFSKEQPLFLRPGISFEETTEGIEFYHSDKFRLRFRGADDLSPALYHNVLKKLRIGGRTACDIAGELLEEKAEFPAYVFFILTKFEQAGLFLEPYELEMQKPS